MPIDAIDPEFFQSVEPPPNLLDTDRALQSELVRRLPTALSANVGERVRRLGDATAHELHQLAADAEASEPVHVPYDAWGRRIDLIRTSPAWDGLKAFAAQHALVATGYDHTLGAHARVAQAALLHLFSATSAMFSCPLAMTDAAARVLLSHGTSTLNARLLPRLLSTDPSMFITSGQWMTERTGGSDVGLTSTVAHHVRDDTYALSGVKWFTSSTTSEIALALARIEEAGADGGRMVAGSKGLTLFLVDVTRNSDGALNGLSVNRLKDKLGTRALPTAELTLAGVKATRVGDVGRGVASVAAMLNVTRYYNTVASASLMHKAQTLARRYAWKRTAFGAPIASHPLHAQTLDVLEAEAAGALAIAMEVAWLLGKSEVTDGPDRASDQELRRLRALIPIAKLTTGKQVVSVVSEALECFGGAGYIEDTGIAVLLRDAQVLPIWEGTTNVLSLDVRRAEHKDAACTALVQDAQRRTQALVGRVADAPLQLLQARLEAVVAEMSSPQAESLARTTSLGLGYAIEVLLLAEAAALGNGLGERARFETLAHHRLGSRTR